MGPRNWKIPRIRVTFAPSIGLSWGKMDREGSYHLLYVGAQDIIIYERRTYSSIFQVAEEYHCRAIYSAL